MSFFDEPEFFNKATYEICKKIRQENEINFKKKVKLEGELSVLPMNASITTKYFKLIDKKLVYFSVIKNLNFLFYFPIFS